MTITLYAQPYDISATGFYFSDYETYEQKALNLRNDFGDRVEEFEIQFIDGELIDAEFAKAFEVNQANMKRFLELADEWETSEKVRFIIGVGEVGVSFDPETDTPDELDIDLYECESLRELAEQFVDEGLYGEIPPSLAYYIDYDAIARDLAVDFTETTVDGVRYVYAAQ